MSENQYGFKYDEYGNTREMLVYGSGISVNGCSFVNKGTAFNDVERNKLGLQACLPPGIRDLNDQIENSAKTVEGKIDDIEKFIFIRSLFDRNVTLAHALIRSDIEKYMPIIYTPTIGEVVKRYSSIFRQANGLHFYPGNIDQAEDILRRFIHRDIRVAVVTDNQGVLGLGDQGAGGITICLGKLMLYSQAAGIAPWHCLPISLDVGTDNEDLLEDEKYLGWRHKRLKGEEYLSFIGRFARAFRNVFPNALCQWEDFSKQNAFNIKDAFAEELISFNDDIQGSGAVALAAILTGLRQNRVKIENQAFIIIGSGAVGIGIAQQIEIKLIAKGLSEKVARERIFVFDSDGLLTTDRIVDHFQSRYAKDLDKNEFSSNLVSIDDVIRKKVVSVVINTIHDKESIFTQNMIESLLGNIKNPIIMNLSRFASSEEIRDIIKWSSGKTLIASSLPRTKCEKENKVVSQYHNIFAFPGVGLGVLASGAREVLPEFFTIAAEVISKQVSLSEMKEGVLLPSILNLKDITMKVSLAVAMAAVKSKISRPCVYSDFQHLDDVVRMKKLLASMRWEPEYLPLIAM